MSVRVVGAARAGVRQHLVGLLALLERLHRRGVATIAVRMVLHRTAPVGLLQLLVGGVAGDAQDFVVVTFLHRGAVKSAAVRPRSEVRRVGKEGVSTGRSGWSRVN